MWRLMGAPGWSYVLYQDTQQFTGSRLKPLIAVRKQADLSEVLARAEDYTKDFNVDTKRRCAMWYQNFFTTLWNTASVFLHVMGYTKVARLLTLRGLSNVLQSFNSRGIEIGKRCPLLSRILALELRGIWNLRYPVFPSDMEAIRYAIRPGVSGTFGSSDPYQAKNNAGVGQYLSSNIVRKLRAQMYRAREMECCTFHREK